VNADLIASGLSPFLPERAAIKAGRLMLERIHYLADHGTDFGFETTLSGKGYVRLIKDLKNRGYRIYLRVADRVRRGGHNVPEKVVRRRFNRGLPNLFNLYRPLLDLWAIFDNSTDHPVMIACEENGDLEIIDSVLFSKLSNDMVRS